MAGVWGRDDFCSPPLLLFLSCRSSPPDSISGTGGRQLGCRFYSIWHLPRGFLNVMHSGLHISQGHVFLCLLGPSQLLWPAIMFCPKELCRCWAQVAHGQMFPGIPRGVFLIWFCNHTSQEGLPYSPCFSCVFFLTIYWNSGTRTYCVAAVSSWLYSLCSNWSRMQEIWDSVLLSQLRGIPKHKNGLVAARFFLAKEGKGYSSGLYKSCIS